MYIYTHTHTHIYTLTIYVKDRRILDIHVFCEISFHRLVLPLLLDEEHHFFECREIRYLGKTSDRKSIQASKKRTNTRVNLRVSLYSAGSSVHVVLMNSSSGSLSFSDPRYA